MLKQYKKKTLLDKHNDAHLSNKELEKEIVKMKSPEKVKEKVVKNKKHE